MTGTYRVEFSYDGAGHRIRVHELDGSSSTTADHYYLWCGDTICEERNGGSPGTATKRYYPWGVDEAGTKYFYTRDHLGSVREITNSTGSVVARYDYDPYGRMTTVYGSKVPAFGYAGYFYNATSGLNLTLFRAYDPGPGRWVSRDPIGESGGLNLYGYVGNDPVGRIDSFGLAPGDTFNTPDEAALDWGEYMASDPKHIDMGPQEWASDIYQTLFGSYSYTDPIPCGSVDCIRPPFMKAWPNTKKAECHSHPTKDKEAGNDGEMDGDKEKARNSKDGMNHYVRTVDGHVYIIFPHSGNSLPLPIN